MTASVMFSPELHQIMVGDYEAAYGRVCVALRAAGFEIMAEIDLAEFLAKKSVSYIKPYKVLVVCHSDITQRAITISPDVGVVLPCHVAVSQMQENQVEVRSADPHMTWNTAANVYLEPIAEELKLRLERVISALKG